MTKEEHAKVLAALEAITKHFSISRLHESTLADTTVRGQAHEAIAIMRKEPEPISDAEISLMAQNDDPGDWNCLSFRDAWHEGYRKGFKAALLEKAR